MLCISFFLTFPFFRGKYLCAHMAVFFQRFADPGFS